MKKIFSLLLAASAFACTQEADEKVNGVVDRDAKADAEGEDAGDLQRFVEVVENSGVLTVALRSLVLGLLSIIPNFRRRRPRGAAPRGGRRRCSSCCCQELRE